MSGRIDSEAVKAMAQDRIHDVLSAIGINERSRGNYISMCNPVRKDRHPSLTIWVKGGAIGAFKDHTGAAQGDVFGLVAYIMGWSHEADKGFYRSLRFLADLFGLERMSDDERARAAAASRKRAMERDKVALENEARNAGRAFALWLDAKPIEGTPVETYLRARGIDLRQPPFDQHIPRILRFLPGHKFKDPDSGEESHWPCMVAGMVDGHGKIRAVHRTWLSTDGRDKAPFKKARKIWPAFGGCVIPLWKGDSGLSISDAIKFGLRETIRLGEGIETCLSLVIGNPSIRTWAFAALDNLGNVPLPECCDGVMLQRENDWTKLSAVEAFERNKAKLEAQGRPVVELKAFHGSDANDTLRG